MPWPIFYEGQILFREGALAMSLDCCCGIICDPNDLVCPPTLTATIAVIEYEPQIDGPDIPHTLNVTITLVADPEVPCNYGGNATSNDPHYGVVNWSAQFGISCEPGLLSVIASGSGILSSWTTFSPTPIVSFNPYDSGNMDMRNETTYPTIVSGTARVTA